MMRAMQLYCPLDYLSFLHFSRWPGWQLAFVFRSLADVANFINSSFILPTISTELVLAKRFCPRKQSDYSRRMQNAKRRYWNFYLILRTTSSEGFRRGIKPGS